MGTSTYVSYDIAIVGGGIMGSTLSYWLGALYPQIRTVLLEQGSLIAPHTSSRNTGVVHRPFYLNPETKRLFAQIASHSYPLLKAYAKHRGLPWVQIGTLEIGLAPGDEAHIERYAKWAVQNGMAPEEGRILTQKEIQLMEPEVFCNLGYFCTTDTGTDFGLVSRALAQDAQSFGVAVHLNTRVNAVEPRGDGLAIRVDEAAELSAKYLVNCAGGNALAIAHRMDVGKEFTDLNFRGEYWVVDSNHRELAHRNIYTVPRHPEFPFLDPHWIRRADGSTEIGPSAVPVFGPYAYSGLAAGLWSGIRKALEPPLRNKFSLFRNREFLALAYSEWRNAFSKHSMGNRVRRFLPSLKDEYLIHQGNSGVRSNLIDTEGRFVREVVEREGEHSLHILNFNSPGATGAPAYGARLVGLLVEKGILPPPRDPVGLGIWNYGETITRLSRDLR
jgi:L-2-hydroxyglutarate oxidase